MKARFFTGTSCEVLSMSVGLQDTIAAIASPSGPAERGIIRISGSATVAAVAGIFEVHDEAFVIADQRRPVRISGRLQLASLRMPLPAALMLWPTDRSYTGQPMAEFHTVGSPPLLDAVLESLFANGVRPANRGEFTMRAFMAGRIDLIQAEAVLGVIDAADHEELEAALTQLGGGITAKLAGVRSEILALLGDLEAGLDFVEEDIEFITSKQICDRLNACQETLAGLESESNVRLPSGYYRRVVLAGLPNAGKSTLFNRLVGASKAIVSPVAGTTRDYLTSVTNFGELEVELIDTAGWETASDLIMERAQGLRAAQLNVSDLVVWCTAADLNSELRKQNLTLKQQVMNQEASVVEVLTRFDLFDKRHNYGISEAQTPLFVSAETGDGISELSQAIADHFSATASSRTELLASTSARCRDSLMKSRTAIEAAILSAESEQGDEVTAFELRDALHEIGTILGEVYTDDILDHIFSNFCIGK